MVEIIKTYGRFLVEVIAFIGVFVLIFFTISDGTGNTGVLAMLGSGMQTPAIEYNSYTDFDVFVTEAAKVGPTAKYLVANQMHVGANNLADYLSATSYSGASLRFKVLDITDTLGNSYMDVYDESGQTVTFSRAGRYTFRIEMVDEINQKRIYDIEVPVAVA